MSGGLGGSETVVLVLLAAGVVMTVGLAVFFFMVLRDKKDEE